MASAHPLLTHLATPTAANATKWVNLTCTAANLAANPICDFAQQVCSDFSFIETFHCHFSFLQGKPIFFWMLLVSPIF